MAGHFCEATVCFLPMGGQVVGVPSGSGDPWKLGHSRCTMCQTVSLMLGDHHNPMSIHWELERKLLQTSVNTHRKVEVEQSGSGALGLGWNLGGAAYIPCGLGNAA